MTAGSPGALRRTYVVAHAVAFTSKPTVTNVSTTLSPRVFGAVITCFMPSAQIAGSGFLIPNLVVVPLSCFLKPSMWWRFGVRDRSLTVERGRINMARFHGARSALDELLPEWLETLVQPKERDLALQLKRLHEEHRKPPPAKDEREYLLSLQAMLQSALVECDAALERGTS